MKITEDNPSGFIPVSMSHAGGPEKSIDHSARALESHSSHWEIRGFGTPQQVQQAQQARRSWPQFNRERKQPQRISTICDYSTGQEYVKLDNH